jgi:hypothetical protein
MNNELSEPSADAHRDAVKASLDAFANDSTALVHIGASQATAANLAYWEAKKRRLAEEEAAMLMARALESSGATCACFRP